jgi:hypothetical protein
MVEVGEARWPVKFHKSRGKIASLTTVPPISRFGMLDLGANDRLGRCIIPCCGVAELMV